MSNQEFISASKFCDLVTDGTHDSPKKTETGIKLVTSKNIVGGSLDLTSAYFISELDARNINKRSQVHINDVLLSMIGTVGEVALIEKEPDFVIKNVGLLKNSDSKKARWLYYYLKSPIAQNLIKDRLRGTTQQYIPLGELRNLPILKPNSEEHLQNTIEQLSSLDKKIQLNTQINQTLEQIAQALFKSWFVDFDPVRAKVQALSDGLNLEQAELAAMQAISGKTPEELTALSQAQPDHYAELAETAKAFPCEMVEVDGVEVPKGWLVSTISECSLKIQNGGTPKRSNLEYWENGDISWLSSGEVCNNKVLVQSKEYITDLGLKGSAAKLIPPYSTLVAIYASPTAGKCAFSGFETSTNQAVCAIIPKEEYTFFNYYHLQLQEKYFANQASGSAQQNISKKIIEETPVLIPNKVILKKFNLLAKPIMNKTIENLKENNNLERKRDLLLPKLLNGEV